MVIYSVIHKRVFTPPRDLMTRIIEAIDHSSNSTMAFTKKFTSRIFCKCKCHCWVWRMIDSLYYSSRKIPERWENSFVNYRINLPKALLFITKDLNSATEWCSDFSSCTKIHYLLGLNLMQFEKCGLSH